MKAATGAGTEASDAWLALSVMIFFALIRSAMRFEFLWIDPAESPWLA